MDYRIEQLRHQLREDPSSRVFYQLGEILRREGSFEEAVPVLRQGLAHHPRYVAAWVSLGRSLLQRESWHEAELALARALELDPENAVAARMLGEAALGRDDLERAIKAFRLARALSPRDASLEERIATVEGRLQGIGIPEQASAAPQVAPEQAAEQPASAEAEMVGRETSTSPPTEEVPSVAGPLAGAVAAEEAPLSSEPFSEREEEGSVVETAPVAPTAPLAGEEAAELATSRAAVAQGLLEAPPVVVGSLSEPVFVASSSEDPFSLAPRGDTGVFVLGGDVFGSPLAGAPGSLEAVGEPASRREVEGAFEGGGEPFTEGEPAAAQESPLEALASLAASFTAPQPGGGEGEVAAGEAMLRSFEESPDEGATSSTSELSAAATVPDLAVEALAADAVPPAAPDLEAGVAAEPDELLEEPEHRGVPDLPVPTLTLARLALDQGDSELAEKTLIAVLDRDPGHQEAAVLLARLRGRAEGVTPVEQGAATVAALQAWLARFRLAAERLGR